MKIDFFPIKQTVRRFAYGLAVMMICRLLFWYFNRDLLAGASFSDFFYGIRFDASVVAYACGIGFLLGLSALFLPNSRGLQTAVKAFFLLGLLGVVTLECFDIGYFRFGNRRTLPGDLGLFLNSRSMIGSLWGQYAPQIASFALLLCLIYAFYGRLRLTPVARAAAHTWKSRLLGMVLFVLSTGLLVIAARGGLQLRPLTPLGAAKYAGKSSLIPLVSNTTLGFIVGVGSAELPEWHFMSEEAAAAAWPVFAKPAPKDSFLRKNVVVLVLESFGKEYSLLQNKHQGRDNLTPFLDSLARAGLYFTNSYANGLRSSQGIVSIAGGLPPLMHDPFMFSPFQSNCLEGVAGALQKKGYATAFFHGSNPGSMDFDKLAKLTGYNAFYDRFSLPDQNDYDGMWGIFDRPMLDFTADKLAQMPEPFMGFFFSLTSHHPYTVPAAVMQQYPNMEPLHRAVRYTDDALRHFFDKIKDKPWFPNTLFVITADHVGAGSPFSQYREKANRFAVPIIFYMPGAVAPGVSEKAVQQIDIVPSVLDFLNYDQPFFAFGRSVFEKNTPPSARYAFQFEEGIWQMMDAQYLILFDGDRVTGLYQYRDDPDCRRDVSADVPAKREEMERVLKAALQQYNTLMRKNGLCPPRK